MPSHLAFPTGGRNICDPPEGGILDSGGRTGLKRPPIVIDVERPRRPSTPRSVRKTSVLRRVVFPALALVTVCSSTVPLLARPAGADQLSDAKAKASQIEAEIQSTGQRISALGQRFDQDQAQVTQLDQQITTTKAKIATDRQEVAKDRATLQSAAINTYVAEGSAGSVSPLFSSNQHTLAEAQTYSQVAEGDLNVSVADLHTAQSQLNQQQSSLQSQQQQATQAANSAQAAEQAAVQVQGQQQAAEAQAQGQVAQIIAQQQ